MSWMKLVFFGMASAQGLAGCGSSVQDDDASSSSGAGGSGGGATVCEGFANAESGTSAVFTIRNESGLPVYFPTGCASVEGTVRMAGPTPRADLTFPWQVGCTATCEDERSESGPPLCDACNAGLLRVETGTSVPIGWDAFALATRDLPGSCTPSGDGVTCQQVVDAPAASYELELTVHAECPDCTCDDAGRCSGEPGGPSSTFSTPFQIPASQSFEVVISNCFFGCAGG